MSAPKKLYIKTYGCQMNVYDSERMAERWRAGPWRPKPHDADDPAEHLPLGEKAAEGLFELGRFKGLRRRNRI